MAKQWMFIYAAQNNAKMHLTREQKFNVVKSNIICAHSMSVSRSATCFVHQQQGFAPARKANQFYELLNPIYGKCVNNCFNWCI